MYFAEDEGTAFFKILTAPFNLANVVFSFFLLLIAFIAIYSAIMYLVRRKLPKADRAKKTVRLP